MDAARGQSLGRPNGPDPAAYAVGMARVRQVFVCRSCGSVHPKWMGKCPDCGVWDALEAERVDEGAGKDPQLGLAGAAVGLSDALEHVAAEARPITDVGSQDARETRVVTGIGEFDRVLGGGLVAGSACLIGGPPGIGKSTLMLQAAGAIAGRSEGGARVLYVSSEESARQIRLRAQRLGLADRPELFILADTNLARIFEQARRTRPAVLIIDSMQMIYKSDLPAPPGSIPQLRRCCAELVALAKTTGLVVVLVGHVTKEGSLAGPRLIEHLVDVVLGFDGDRHHAHRIVRGVKNRFGTTQELGLFEMTGAGLREAPAWGGGSGAEEGRGRPGSVICPVIAGTRCLMVEIQALTATGFLGAAKRKCSGLDPNRLAMIIAVLEQHLELKLAIRDVFASSVGGLRVTEPAADLALLLAIAGAELKRGFGRGVAAVGEVGLGGEVRPVANLEQRIREAGRLGFSRILLPKQADAKVVGGVGTGLELVTVMRVGDAAEMLG